LNSWRYDNYCALLPLRCCLLLPMSPLNTVPSSLLRATPALQHRAAHCLLPDLLLLCVISSVALPLFSQHLVAADIRQDGVAAGTCVPRRRAEQTVVADTVLMLRHHLPSRLSTLVIHMPYLPRTYRLSTRTPAPHYTPPSRHPLYSHYLTCSARARFCARDAHARAGCTHARHGAPLATSAQACLLIPPACLLAAPAPASFSDATLISFAPHDLWCHISTYKLDKTPRIQS